MLTKAVNKNVQSNGDHLSCGSFAEYIGHIFFGLIYQLKM
jgi:hypothetical protein